MEQDIKNILDNAFKRGYLIAYLDENNKVKYGGEMPLTTLGNILPIDKILEILLHKVVK